MLSKQLEEGFDNPQVQVEYLMFSVCSDVHTLCTDYDKNKALETFLTKEAAEELHLAAVRLSSLAAAITLTLNQ